LLAANARANQPDDRHGTPALMGQTTKNQVRIIGGLWKGRKLRFPAGAGLRPTRPRLPDLH